MLNSMVDNLFKKEGVMSKGWMAKLGSFVCIIFLFVVIVSGCASQKALNEVKTTADTALKIAQEAKAKADEAASKADTAMKKADEAMSVSRDATMRCEAAAERAEAAAERAEAAAKKAERIFEKSLKK